MAVVVGPFSHETEWHPLLQSLPGIVEDCLIAGQLLTAISDTINRTDA